MSTHALVPERPLQPGDLAPNFDLTSTADVVLMLCDEVPRTAVLLYCFRAADQRVRSDLGALAARRGALARLRAKVLVMSALPLQALKDLQAELALPFPLLRDDRGFLDVYGLAGLAGLAGTAAMAGVDAEPALYLVDRRQRLLWIGNPLPAIATALPEIEQRLRALPSPTEQYPKSVVNRRVDRRVN